jgi:hypothetical protein
MAMQTEKIMVKARMRQRNGRRMRQSLSQSVVSIDRMGSAQMARPSKNIG